LQNLPIGEVLKEYGYITQEQIDQALQFQKTQSGKKVRFGTLLQEMGFVTETQVLEALGIIFLLEPYSNNVLKRTVSTPKLYFYDSGIVCYLTRWSSPETAMEGAMSGALLENYTVAEIIKTYQNAGQEPFLYYYRDKDAREIDLILERDGKLFPIEIKKMASPPKKLTKVFDLIDKSPLQRGTGAILCMADQLGAFDQNNLIVPISLI